MTPAEVGAKRDLAHWLALTPCGCPESVATVTHHPTPADAFDAWYWTDSQRRSAIDRGVRVVGITAAEWAEVWSRRFGKPCRHAEAADV